MTRAFFFLWLCTFKNKLLARARRLRQPRYLISALIGVAYFYGVAGRHWVRGFRMASASATLPIPPEFLELIGAAFVLVSAVLAWCGPTPLSPLAYTEAEIQYLFPAPIPRKGLVRWKILKGQTGVLISVLIFTLITAPRVAPGGIIIFFAGAWLAFATMQLYLIGTRMTLHSLGKRGIGWTVRTAIILPVFLLAVAGAGYWALTVAGPLPSMPDDFNRAMEQLTSYRGQILGTWPMWLLMAPGRLLVKPMLAPNIATFLMVVPPVLGLLFLSHLWTVRSGVALEEGAIEAAKHLSETKTGLGQGRMRRQRRIRATKVPFVLAPTGRPEVALFWKNLIAAFRTVGGIRVLLLALVGTLGINAVILRTTSHEAMSAVVGGMCAMFAVLLLLVGPAVIRCDFRQDLLHIDLLKSYPLSGRSLLVGSLMTPVIILTIVEWMLLVAFAVILPSAGLDKLNLSAGPAILALTAGILAPCIIATSTLIQNAGFLIVPGWVALGTGRTTGVERIGQGLLTSLGHILAMAIGFIPAFLIFFVTWFFASGFLGNAIALPLAASFAALVLGAECLVGAMLLGSWLDRLDPSREFDTLARQE